MTTVAGDYNNGIRAVGRMNDRIRKLEARNALLEAVREAADNLDLFLARWPLPSHKYRDLCTLLARALQAAKRAPTEPPQEGQGGAGAI